MYFQVLLLIISAQSVPNGYLKRSPEEAEGDHNEHLFHGTHLWGLEDFHQPAEEARRKRSPEEAEGDHNEHLFHGSHLWGLEDFHQPAEEARRKRSPEEVEDHNEHLFHVSHL